MGGLGGGGGLGGAGAGAVEVDGGADFGVSQRSFSPILLPLRFGAAEIDVGQAGAVFERTASNTLDAGRDNNTGQAGAITERAPDNTSHTSGNVHIRQALAMPERT